MAVDLSTKSTDVNTQVESPTRLVQPVTGDNVIEGLNRIAMGVGVGAKTIAQALQNGAVDKQNKYMADYIKKFENLTAAADQGKMTATQARVLQRTLLTDAVTNNPNISDKILQLHSKLLNESGYDKIATPARQQAEIEQQQVATLVQNGFLAVTDVNNEDKKAKALQNYTNYQSTISQLTLNMKEIDQKAKGIDLSTKQRAELDAQKKDVAETGLHKIANAAMPYWKTKYSDWKQKINSAPDEATKNAMIKQAMIDFDQDFNNQIMQITGSTVEDLGSDKVNQITAPMKNMIDAYKKELSGQYDTEQAKAAFDNAQAQSEMSIWSGLSEADRKVITLNKLMSGGGAAVLMNRLDNVATHFLTQNTGENGKPADLIQPEDHQTSIKKYFDGIGALMEKSNKGGMQADSKAELDKQLTSIMKGVSIYGAASENAKEFQPMVDFLSSATFGQYMAKGGSVPQEFINKAGEIIQRGYQEQVIPLLKGELDNTLYQTIQVDRYPYQGIDKGTKFSDVAEPSFTNGRFGFKVKDGIDNPAIKKWVDSQNSSAFTKVVNKMIMLDAHMKGNTDYQKAWDTLSPIIFDMGGKTTDQGGALGGMQNNYAPEQKSNTNDAAKALNDLVNIPEAAPQHNKADATPSNVPYIEYANKGAVRNEPLSPKLTNTLSYLGDLGVTARVFSGGQEATGPRRTGSHRHDHGNAADVFFYKDGRRLDWADPADRKIFEEIVRRGKAAGITGFGAGHGYMRQGSMHIGFGTPAVWGAGGHAENAPSWLVNAYNG